MKERPILFSGQMVRAILEGRKTQTRRVIKLKNFEHNTDVPWCEDWMFRDPRGAWNDASTERLIEKYCPYGKPGDRLWVRETIGVQLEPCPEEPNGYVVYKADLPYGSTFEYEGGGSAWKPSIFMPRWASRITLEITNVRVERVADISLRDVVAEGIAIQPGADRDETRAAYRTLWDKLNAKLGYPWDSNPWVWVIEFKVVEK